MFIVKIGCYFVRDSEIYFETYLKFKGESDFYNYFIYNGRKI